MRKRISRSKENQILLEIYQRLYNAFGPQKWWPAQTSFEVIVGAILTQNTSWNNVEIAIKNLKTQRLLAPSSLYFLKNHKLAALIKPAGYYNLKAKRVKNFLDYLFKRYKGSLAKMFKRDWKLLRQELLEIKGVGPETADSILLYAANKPVFVVDTYTRRILKRHRLIFAKSSYEEIQKLFMENLPTKTALFNEYHALLVHLGKYYCRTVPDCQVCPLKGL